MWIQNFSFASWVWLSVTGQQPGRMPQELLRWEVKNRRGQGRGRETGAETKTGEFYSIRASKTLQANDRATVTSFLKVTPKFSCLFPFIYLLDTYLLFSCSLYYELLLNLKTLIYPFRHFLLNYPRVVLFSCLEASWIEIIKNWFLFKTSRPIYVHVWVSIDTWLIVQY